MTDLFKSIQIYKKILHTDRIPVSLIIILLTLLLLNRRERRIISPIPSFS